MCAFPPALPSSSFFSFYLLLLLPTLSTSHFSSSFFFHSLRLLSRSSSQPSLLLLFLLLLLLFSFRPQAFALLTWRKSVLYCLVGLSVMMVFLDAISVYKEFIYWGHLGEMEGAPMYHGVSGFRPYDIFDDYMDPAAREVYGLPLPSTWTTLAGHVRVKSGAGEGLCLATSEAAPGIATITLERCGASEELHVSSLFL